MKKISILIPARGGSKGIPNKNIKFFAGKPLIVHSIEYGLNSKIIEEIFVSTDDDEIAQISTEAGANILHRPASISTDKSTTESAIEHFIQSKNKKPDIIVLLQATSPIRPTGSLDKIITNFINEEFDSLLSICPTHRFYWNINKNIAIPNHDFMNRPLRQEIKSKDKIFVENGSIYIFTLEHFQNTGNRLGGKIGFVEWPEEYSLEIDSPQDFFIAEQIFNNLSI